MSNDSAIYLDNLSKRFGQGKSGRLAVDALTLEVKAGQVFGFLGQNGAGKTTTIRLLLDLMRPTGGTAYLFGADPRHNRSVLRRVGALVEGAAFYPYLSGRANLELLQRMNDGKSQPIAPLLARVGLEGRGEDRFDSYSMGMKQRLGIAAALLSNPDLVILDEPTNGFDPVGMVEMRTTIRDLVEKDGKTVFLSSHLLNEVEQVCDRVAIINQGQLVREGKITDLLAGHERVKIEVNDAAHALKTLTSPGSWQTESVAEENSITVTVKHDQIPSVIAALVNGGTAIYAVNSQRDTLESLFLSLVAHNNGASSHQESES
jgi:ABC-2 type transport system ATP-binding protein